MAWVVGIVKALHKVFQHGMAMFGQDGFGV